LVQHLYLSRSCRPRASLHRSSLTAYCAPTTRSQDSCLPQTLWLWSCQARGSPCAMWGLTLPHDHLSPPEEIRTNPAPASTPATTTVQGMVPGMSQRTPATGLQGAILRRDGRRVWRLDVLDDASRYLLASVECERASSQVVLETMRRLIKKYRRPLQVLTDNGAVFVSVRGGLSAF